MIIWVVIGVFRLNWLKEILIRDDDVNCYWSLEADVNNTEWFMMVVNWCIRIFVMSYHRN